MKYSLIIFTIIIIIIGIKLFLHIPSPDSANITINNKNFSLEIAKTSIQKSRGLSNRESLCPTCGMIFVYQTEGVYPFWMKDTLIPLDIIWIDSQGKIIDIITGKPKDLTILKSKKLSQYIIELNAGTALYLNLKIGDQIQIPQNL